jgi:hypothetical protein
MIGHLRSLKTHRFVILYLPLSKTPSHLTKARNLLQLLAQSLHLTNPTTHFSRYLGQSSTLQGIEPRSVRFSQRTLRVLMQPQVYSVAVILHILMREQREEMLEGGGGRMRNYNEMEGECSKI